MYYPCSISLYILLCLTVVYLPVLPVPSIIPDVEWYPDATQIAQLSILLNTLAHAGNTQVILTPEAAVPVVATVALFPAKCGAPLG